MQGEFHILRSERQARDFVDHLICNHDWKQPISIQTEKNIGGRTLPQNAAIRVFDKHLSIAMNEAGVTQKVYFEKRKEGANVLWTPNQVHENIFNPMVVAITQKPSSSKMNRSEVSEVHFQLDNWFAEQLPQVEFPPFPNREAFKNV